MQSDRHLNEIEEVREWVKSQDKEFLAALVVSIYAFVVFLCEENAELNELLKVALKLKD